ALTDVLCFGFPGKAAANAAQGGTLSPEAMRSGIVAGVQDYGNKMGIPTVNGGIHYHAAYASNPLVYCGCVGIAPKGAFHSEPRPGDRVFCVGGKTGRDGIRGATFSSMTMDETTLGTAGSSVQIGDPIVEKKVSELILAARDAGLYTGITDCGAGGLSSAVGEMASELGADIELSAVGLKYPGLAPWEIWLSEAQERMVLAVDPAKAGELSALCETLDVEYWDLGSFTGTGRLIVRFRGDTVLDLDCGFLHGGMPRRRLKAYPPEARIGYDDSHERLAARADKALVDFSSLYRSMLSHHAIASRGWVVRRYDHEVQGATRIGPMAGLSQKGPSDAALLVPLDCSGKMGISISNGFNPRYGEADPYRAAWSALDEAVRGAVASGADPDRIAVVDNFCWGDPKKPENMWSLLLAAKGCRDAAVAHRSPFVSGKDSFNNEFVDEDGKRVSVPPSLLISAMGVVPDPDKAPTTDLKEPGSLLYLVGDFNPKMEASVLQDILATGKSGIVSEKPWKPADRAPAAYRSLYKAIRAGLVASCHDLSEGGFGVALAEMCIGGGLGAEVDMHAVSGARSSSSSGEALDDLILAFGETDGCLLCEIEPDKAPDFEASMGSSAFRVGKTMARAEIVFAGIGAHARGKPGGRVPRAMAFDLSDLEQAFGSADEDPEERGSGL
ncbi:MAG TPA: AIR synthase-related protein, partial [Rectinemataceae bacterium]